MLATLLLLLEIKPESILSVYAYFVNETSVSKIILLPIERITSRDISVVSSFLHDISTPSNSYIPADFLVTILFAIII